MTSVLNGFHTTVQKDFYLYSSKQHHMLLCMSVFPLTSPWMTYDSQHLASAASYGLTRIEDYLAQADMRFVSIHMSIDGALNLSSCAM